MPKRCTNIHKRKDCRWEGRIKIGRYPNGATRYYSVYGKSYAEVKEKLDLAKTGDVSPIKGINPPKSFEEITFLWLNSIQITVKQATLYRYEYLLEQHILPTFGRCKICDITSAAVNKFLNNKLRKGMLNGKGGLSPAYVKAMSNIIKSVIEYGAMEGFCSPLKTKINNPTNGKTDVLILSNHEQERLKTYIDEHVDLTGLGILISLYAGLRIGEVCALTWSDIDLEAEVIHVRHTVSRIRIDSESGMKGSRLILDKPKTKASQRDIPISSILMPYLCTAHKEAISDYVVSNKAEFLSPRTFEYRYRKIMRKCAIDDFNYHALRHTFATRCVEAEVDIKSLSEMLGHSSVSITLNTYVHSSMDMKRRQIEKLPI